MVDSDEEYVAELSEDDHDDSDDDGDDDDLDTYPTSRGSARTSRANRRKQRRGAEWEVSRTWETLVEGADGTISSTVGELLEAGKRKR
jgi:transcription initiation factor TFIIH subunit 2